MSDEFDLEFMEAVSGEVSPERRLERLASLKNINQPKKVQSRPPYMGNRLEKVSSDPNKEQEQKARSSLPVVNGVNKTGEHQKSIERASGVVNRLFAVSGENRRNGDREELPRVIYPANESKYSREQDLNNIYTVYRIRNEYEERKLAAEKRRSIGGKQMTFRVGNDEEWDGEYSWSEKIMEVLRRKFKMENFRLIQRPVINAILSKEDVFCCMPTGGGKSLIFQVPALASAGFTVVFMPIIALIQDQMRKMEGLGIPYLSTVTRQGKDSKEVEVRIGSAIESGKSDFKLLFITPEKFAKSTYILELLIAAHRKGLIQRVVIDEAHCVSGWGHEFRPDYLKLKDLKNHFPAVQILALTATATKTVRVDVMSILQMHNPLYFSSDFDRPNLTYSVVSKDSKYEHRSLLNQLKNYPGMAGIIYCSTTKECDELVTMLYKEKIHTRPYHGKMIDKDRLDSLNMWLDDSVKIIVATIAFGMGVDKPDVRFVIHYNLSKSIENYYQESGRAGRDGQPADCILLYSSKDVSTYDFLSAKESRSDWVVEKNKFQLNQMQRYCEEESVCRRQFLLLYFGLDFDRKDCNQRCDSCRKNYMFKKVDYSEHFWRIMECFETTDRARKDSMLTPSQLAEVLRGTMKEVWKTEILPGLHNSMEKYRKAEVEMFVNSMVRNSYFKLVPKEVKTNRYFTLAFDPMIYSILSLKKQKDETLGFYMSEIVVGGRSSTSGRFVSLPLGVTDTLAPENNNHRSSLLECSEEKEEVNASPFVQGLKVGRNAKKMDAEYSHKLSKKKPKFVEDFDVPPDITEMMGRDVVVDGRLYGLCMDKTTFDDVKTRLNLVLMYYRAKLDDPKAVLPDYIIDLLAKYLPTTREEYQQIDGFQVTEGFEKYEPYLYKEIIHISDLYKIDRSLPWRPPATSKDSVSTSLQGFSQAKARHLEVEEELDDIVLPDSSTMYMEIHKQSPHSGILSMPFEITDNVEHPPRYSTSSPYGLEDIDINSRLLAEELEGLSIGDSKQMDQELDKVMVKKRK